MVKLKNDIFNTQARSLALDGSTAVTSGHLMYRDTTNSCVKEATSTAGKIEDLAGVAVQTVASGATEVNVIPIISSMGQLWEVDCTNATNANQLFKAQPMTDAATCANAGSHTATSLAVFIPVAVVSASKLLGYFAMTSQVIA